MRSHNDLIDTSHTPPSLSFYNTFKFGLKLKKFTLLGKYHSDNQEYVKKFVF
jgi:hypothetical protein